MMSKVTMMHWKKLSKEDFEPDPRAKWQRTAELYFILQNQSTVEDFIAKITTKATELQLSDEQTFNIILNGLKPCIRQFVLQQNPGTIQDLAQSAKLAQLTVVDNSNVQNSLVAAVSRNWIKTTGFISQCSNCEF